MANERILFMKMYTPDTPQNKISNSMFNTLHVFLDIFAVSSCSTATPFVVIVSGSRFCHSKCV